MKSHSPVSSSMGMRPIDMKVSRSKKLTSRKIHVNDEHDEGTHVEDSFDLLNANGSDRVFNTDTKHGNIYNSFDMFPSLSKNLEAQ